jgi:hypothetical protein
LAAGVASNPQDEFPKLDASEEQKPLPYVVGLQRCAQASRKRNGAQPAAAGCAPQWTSMSVP